MGGSQVKATARIFLSYARPDEGKVKNLYQRLSDAGFKPWMDKKDILPGEIWQSCIQKAIERSDFFLTCLSANSVNRRGFLQREIKDALDIWQEMLEDDIYLIPVRLEDCEAPESLRKFQWVNLFEEDGWTRLVKAIQEGMERREEGPERLLQRDYRQMPEESAPVCKILVVDNNLDFRSTLTGLLTDAGHTVRPVANEGGALTAVIQEPFDFALVDVRLHEEGEEDDSGLSLAMALRALRPDVRVILLTRYVRTRQIVRAIRYLGVIDFIDKNTQDWAEQVLETITEARQKAERPRFDEGVQQPDVYSIYENGLYELVNQIKGDNPRYPEVLVYQFRLSENIARSRRYGDTDTCKAERSEIVERLNEIALSEVDASFNELCKGVTFTTRREPLEVARFEKAGSIATSLSLSLAADRPLVVRARGRYICSMYEPKTLQVDVERYARRAEIARRDPDNLRFQVQEIGLNLWRDIFVEHPEAAWAYMEARGKSQPLALIFETPREFLRLPLEFLRSATPPEYMILQHPFVRLVYGATPKREEISHTLARTKKLQVLIIASNTQPPIDGVDAEAQELYEYLKGQDCIPVSVKLVRTERATYERVRSELRKHSYDIVHYAGHGTYRTESPEESCLYFWAEENKQGDIVPMKATELKLLLERSEARLVYMSSCYGTATSAQAALLDDDFLGLADAVAQAGVPSVLGFRWPVSDDGARRLALAFYQSLLEQGGPEFALWSARRELAAVDRNDPTWLSPILIHQE